MRKSMDKIKNFDDILLIVSSLRKTGKKIVTTNGSFDLIHSGHVKTLEAARELGDALIVLINDDASVRKHKGDKRPIISEDERAEMIAALECVDYVFIFSGQTPLSYLEKIKPDFHVKGSSWDSEKIKEEKNLVESWKGKHVCMPEVPGRSTTNLINKIISVYGKE